MQRILALKRAAGKGVRGRLPHMRSFPRNKKPPLTPVRGGKIRGTTLVILPLPAGSEGISVIL